MFLLSYFQKNEYKSSKRTVDYRPCPECSSVHTPILSSFFLHLDLLINYSIITIIYSTFYLFVYKMRRTTLPEIEHTCVSRRVGLSDPWHWHLHFASHCKSLQVCPLSMLLFCPMTTKGSALKKVWTSWNDLQDLPQGLKRVSSLPEVVLLLNDGAQILSLTGLVLKP